MPLPLFHKNTLISYAKHYGKTRNVTEAKMISLNKTEMVLEVDSEEITIPFDHQLASSEDAHKTLVRMHRDIAEGGKTI